MSFVNKVAVFRLLIVVALVSLILNFRNVSMVSHAAKDNAKIKVFDVARGTFVELEMVQKTDEEWEKVLTPEQFQITRKKGTERAFTGQYWNSKKNGVYKCIACGNDLFVSGTKFDSKTGWPSFFQPVAAENVREVTDDSHFMQRVEVICARCGAHLGHVFDDGPKPTGKRFCMNSAALKFTPAEKQR